ncbi:thrombospondin type 1 domain protein [Dictyocaulus viviparus]|uniref:Thrombospondin type 1 domain protein n=1 Tax=Dictyocaulus viviparus TaxID=29172 RepID=A0A0D8XE99_DICVI|nr:thrombospondin type 1 domain protein [Dictyocaulus viviparus]
MQVVAHGGRIVTGVDEVWGEWTKWTECSHTCGGGTKRRARVCIGRKCPSQPLEAVKESCNEQLCPRDEDWSIWSDWSSCSISCGEKGVQSRRRQCLKAFVFQCTGQSMETRECSLDVKCESQEYSSSIPSWSAWSSWSSCSCHSLMETRRRFCVVIDPSVQGFCTGSVIEQRPCVPTTCGASPGGWSEWSDWSKCSKDCQGTGHQIRNRMCAEPLPTNRGMYCVGYSFDQRPCTISTPCGDPVDGGWTEWSEWSTCDKSCTDTQRSRTRFCTNPRPSQGGQPCFGSDFELQPCLRNAGCYSINGAWGLWSAWSQCPEGCGFALQSRYRACDSPPPSHGGQICRGLAHQTSVCDIEFCDEAVDGEWSAWNEWSLCMGNCGLGSRTRVRACVSPPPTSGGVWCFGKSSESEECQAESSLCSQFLSHANDLDMEINRKVH